MNFVLYILFILGLFASCTSLVQFLRYGFSLCLFSWFMLMSLFLVLELWKVKQKSQWFLSLSGAEFLLMLLDVEELYFSITYLFSNVLAILIVLV